MRHIDLSDGSKWIMPEIGFAPGTSLRQNQKSVLARVYAKILRMFQRLDGVTDPLTAEDAFLKSRHHLYLWYTSSDNVSKINVLIVFEP